ncbi:MAG: transcription termination factor Rho [Oscillospiraceae bacterium]|nr:transcription termination factor Rho [Oscillospiraceae bacterium]
MQDGVKLERKTKEELKQIAQGLGIEKISALKKDEIIALIREKREQMAQEAKQNAQPKKRERPADVVEVKGILDVMADGFGFLRVENYLSSKNDIYVSPTQIRRFNLKTGDELVGDCRPSQDEDKYSPLLFVKTINEDPIDVALRRRPFERLTPIYPTEKLSLDTGEREKLASRLIDIVTPIGKGQRGMIVAPPKAGKTTIIKQVAQSISKNHPDVKLIVLLIDERPEEVTDIKRSIDGEVVYSTFDQMPENHCKVAEMVLERASRLVEQKKDVVILLDSITRLARAHNLTVTPTGRTLSGGLDPDALFKPKKFFGAARNIEEGGSLTILATALVETGSRMDDVIFEEFKGTGNMELKLDRLLQEKRIFPAIDILKSGTRREEDLLDERELTASRIIRREMGRSMNSETMSGLLQYLKNTRTNKEFVELMIKNYGK